MSRDRGDWIPWYVETSPGWAELSLAARGVAEGIARLMGRKRGELHLGSRGLRGLCLLLHARWEEFEPAMAELLAAGPNGEAPRLLLSEDHRTLIDPDHESRQRPSSSERVARHRAKSNPPPPPDVTPVTPVTVTSVTSDRETPVTGVRVTSPLLSSDLISSPEGEPEREAPGWFAETADRVMADTGEKFGVPEAWIRYSGHRANKGLPANARDAAYWLGTVMVPEARKERRAESDRKQARSGTRMPQDEPVPIDPAKERALAKELVQRVLGARKGAA